MIFDFERCFYQPTSWHFEAYYEGAHETKEQAIEYCKQNCLEITTDRLKHRTCLKFAKLTMKFLDEEVIIRFYDEDIEKMIIAIRSAHKRGDNYVFCNISEFTDYHEALYQQVENCGSINTYQC